MVSIYSPSIRREAQRLGITELQAYRREKQREEIIRRNAVYRPCRFD